MNVVDLAQAALSSDGPMCLPGLAAHLSRDRWEALTRSTGLNRATYGTNRLLEANVQATREDLVAVTSPDASASSGRRVIVETLRGGARDRYANLGIDFHPEGTLDPAGVEHALGRAMATIGRVPEAAAAVGSVLAVLHVIRSPEPEYDVSYSDPFLPFSAFVGLPDGPNPCGDLRLAEGVLHECMHLQLSLIENVLPMVSGSEDRLRSPWQGVPRPTQGNLHGLYVFRVLQWFHREVGAHDASTGPERRHSEARIRTIEEEVRSLSELARSRDLTEAGRVLTARLLAAA